MDTYSLNPNILPGDPILNEKHHRAIVVTLAVACIAVVIAFLLWWMGVRVSTNTVIPQPKVDARMAMAALLRTKTITVSADDINKMASVLTKTKTTATVEDQNAMATVLRQKTAQSQ
jgi:hypothetical protein